MTKDDACTAAVLLAGAGAGFLGLAYLVDVLWGVIRELILAFGAIGIGGVSIKVLCRRD